MPRRPSLRRRLETVIEQMRPEVRAAFNASIADIVAAAGNTEAFRRLVEALEARNIPAAVEALNIEEAAFRPLRRAIERSYDAGGTSTVAGMPRLQDRAGARVLVRFDVEFPRAEQWLRTHSSTAITRITADMRSVARSTIADGYALGRHPHAIGIDLVGRINAATGLREGGVLGLSSPQADHVLSMRRRLLSGDPAEMRKVLAMTRRDRRFDPTIMRAIKEGRPVSATDVDRLTSRYSARLLDLRGETVARTEVGEAVMASKREAFIQGLEKTGYTEQAVTRRWRHSGRSGKHARDQHVAMNNVAVQGLQEPYTLPDGTQMMHPMDTSLGAGPDHLVNCACDEEIDIDFSEGVI